MKKFHLKTIIGLASVLALALTLAPPAARAGAYVPVQGIYIDGSTNTLLVGTTTNRVSVVAATSTNAFNLPGASNNTNLWPMIQVPGPLVMYPWQTLDIQAMGETMDGNTSNPLYLVLAGSTDNSHWITNYATVSIGTNGLLGATFQFNLSTNLGAVPFFAVQELRNAGTYAVTNLWLNFTVKPGL